MALERECALACLGSAAIKKESREREGGRRPQEEGEGQE